MARANTAVCEGRDLRELDIKVLGRWRRASGEVRRPMRTGASSTARGPNRDILTRSRPCRASTDPAHQTGRRPPSTATPSGAVRATMPVMAGHRSILRIRRLAAVLAGAGRRRARRRGTRAGPRPGPGRAADRGVAPSRLDFRAAAYARHGRGGRLVAVGGPPRGRRSSGQPGPASPHCRPSWPGMTALAFALLSGIGLLRHPPSSRSTWSSTCC